MILPPSEEKIDLKVRADLPIDHPNVVLIPIGMMVAIIRRVVNNLLLDPRKTQLSNNSSIIPIIDSSSNIIPIMTHIIPMKIIARRHPITIAAMLEIIVVILLTVVVILPMVVVAVETTIDLPSLLPSNIIMTSNSSNNHHPIPLVGEQMNR